MKNAEQLISSLMSEWEREGSNPRKVSGVIVIFINKKLNYFISINQNVFFHSLIILKAFFKYPLCFFVITDHIYYYDKTTNRQKKPQNNKTFGQVFPKVIKSLRWPGYRSFSALDPWLCVSTFQRICPFDLFIIFIILLKISM